MVFVFIGAIVVGMFMIAVSTSYLTDYIYTFGFKRAARNRLLMDQIDREIHMKEIESDRIKAGCCPKCGEAVKDKGSLIVCISCDFVVTNGVWDEHYGYCTEIVDNSS